MPKMLFKTRVRTLGLAIALTLGTTPVLAQEMDHSKMLMPAPKPAPVDKQVEAKKPAAGKPANDPHAGHAMPAHATETETEPVQSVDHAAMGHDTPAETRPPGSVDHAAMGHETPPQEPAQEMDHAAMGHETPDPAQEPLPPVDHAAMGHDMSAAPTQPIEPIPPVTAADRIAAFPDVAGHAVHDTAIHSLWLLDRLEAWNADEGTGVGWEAISWIGTDLDRVWLRSEGERVDGVTESADIEVLYGRAIARWWDVVAGVRHDFGEGPSQTFAAIGVQGLAPQMFEVEATAYVGESGQTAARFEVEYDTLFTNRLILQWLAEAELYGKDDARRGIGSGLSTVEVGLRLRYEFSRKLAPYIGIVRERAFGGTADFRREDGEDIDDTRFVAGIRIWF